MIKLEDLKAGSEFYKYEIVVVLMNQNSSFNT